ANSLMTGTPNFGVTPFTINATGTAGAAAQVSIVSSTDNQTGVAQGTPVANAPAVIVRDNLGNPVAGTSVTFTVGGGSGVITDGVGGSGTQLAIVADASGTATLGSWTLGQLGANTLTAAVTSNSSNSATIHATG